MGVVPVRVREVLEPVYRRLRLRPNGPDSSGGCLVFLAELGEVGMSVRQEVKYENVAYSAYL